MSKSLKITTIALLFLVAYSLVALSVQAVPTYTLEVERDGKGEITVTPNQRHFEEGTLVTLIATPTPGWIFLGWSGKTGHRLWEAQPPEITITMTADTRAKAKFYPEGLDTRVRTL